MSQDSWDRNKGLYYSWHSKQFGHHVYVDSSCPQSREADAETDLRGCCTPVGLPYSPGNLSLGMCLRELLVNLLNRCLRGRHLLYYLGQHMTLDSEFCPRGGTISIFQCCLLYKRLGKHSPEQTLLMLLFGRPAEV